MYKFVAVEDRGIIKTEAIVSIVKCREQSLEVTYAMDDDDVISESFDFEDSYQRDKVYRNLIEQLEECNLSVYNYIG